MARLHEHQGKALLESHGVPIPQGQVVSTPHEARAVAERLGGRVVLKVQAWVTGRAAQGGVVFASDADEAEAAAQRLLAMRFGDFPVSEVLVERALDVRDELFVSLSIDDAAQAPVLLLDWRGGSGIEGRAETVTRLPVDVKAGADLTEARRALGGSPIDRCYHDDIVAAIEGVVELARTVEARSLEVNPLVTTPEGVVAADCRMTIDDYAVFRHPDLNISIARELDHPATELERIAYRVEQADHRGTFYFAQLTTDAAPGSRGLIGFHGAGGGGSMMSMDAVAGQGFTLANYCDTSGNPSAAKVYRAARIILAQPGLVGYFGSGSGVASQEQYHSAYGLAKAFWELE
ncbi:MAG: ATP-grasp domain-containing protein, partial [Planctomycetota bacterium]